MNLDEIRYWAAANMTPSDHDEIRSRDVELDEEEGHLKTMPHGKDVGFTEMMDIANNPHLSEFFGNAEEILALDEVQEKRFTELRQKYTFGQLTPEEIQELKEVFFEPYNIKKLQQTKDKE